MRLTWIPAQLIKVETAYRHDLSQFIVGGVWIKPGQNDGLVRLWKVSLSDFSNAGELPFQNAAGKDDSVSIEILDSGDVIVTISEALPGQGGATSQPDVQRIPAVFGALPVGGAGVDSLVRTCLRAVRTALLPLG